MAEVRKETSANDLLEKTVNILRIISTDEGNKEYGGHSIYKKTNVFGDDEINQYCEWVYHLPLPAKDANVLEIGSGTGWASCALYHHNKERIRSMVACDINPDAVENTCINFKRHSIPGDVFISDVFDGIPQEKKFDLIFWNAPFFCAPENESLTPLLMSVADAGHQSLKRYIRDSSKYLTPGGKVAFLFSEQCADMAMVRAEAEKHGKRIDMIWKKLIHFTDPSSGAFSAFIELYLINP